MAFNQLLTVGKVTAGIFSHSLALISDAAHNFNGANASLIAYLVHEGTVRFPGSEPILGWLPVAASASYFC